MQHMEGGGRTGACPWWEGVGARVLAPLENEKKRLSKEILISSTYILLTKLGGIGVHAKWKGVGGEARVHGRGGGLAPH